MKSNEELQSDVQNAIKWEPLLNAAEIGVTVKNGVVTLTGVVDSYPKKLEAEEAAKSVAGVKAVVEKIEIKFTSTIGLRTDNEIANEVLEAFRFNYEVPNDKVKIKVENGWITLDGQLEWNYQKDAAKQSAGNLVGVRGVTNNIIIKSDEKDMIEKEAIESALMRNWSIDDDDIDVEVNGNKVTLNGTVTSYYQRDEAERIAWNAPGVWNVDNELVIEYN